MKNHIAEELPARKFAPASSAASPAAKDGQKEGGGKSPEKRVKQAIYDIRYRARREDLPIRQAYSQYMQNSSMSQLEKTAIKQKLFGKGGMQAEDFHMEEFASDCVANALYKVFVEGVQKEEEPIVLTYVEEMETSEHRKYKVRVTDKNGKSYVRYADRAKISQLRSNPNIESVEMTGYGEPYEGEKNKGELTAKAKRGEKLDPVGKEDSDINNNGIENDPSDKYLKNRRNVRGAAIAKEAFIADAVTAGKDQNDKQIKPMPKGQKNNVVVAPGPKNLMAHNELEGEQLDEKITANTDMGVAIKDFQKSKSPQLAGRSKESRRDAAIAAVLTARRGGKKLGEETSCEMDDKSKSKKNEGEEDVRAIPTKVNLIKNKLRAMGLKMSYEPEGETIDELNRYEKETGKDYKTGRSVTKGGTMGGDDTNSKVMRHMQKVMGAGKMGAGGPIKPRGKGKVPGQKPPAAGEYGSERLSPEQIVKNRRIAKQQGKDNMSSRFD